jgi:hypothetical protein
MANKSSDSLEIIEEIREGYELLYQNTDSGASILRQAHLKSMALSDSLLIGKTTMNLGIMYFFIGELDSSLSNLQNALAILKNIDSVEYVRTLVNYNTILINTDNLEAALPYLDECIQLCEKMGRWRNLALSYSNKGHIYSQTGDYQKALRFYKLSAIVAKENGFNRQVALEYGNISIQFDNLGIIDSAMFYQEESIKIFEEIEDYFNLSNAYTNVSTLIEDINERVEVLQKGEDAALKGRNLLMEVRAVAALVECHVELNNTDAVREKLSRLEALIKQDQYDPETQLHVYESFSKGYAHIDAFQKAFDNQSKFIHLNDSVNSVERTMNIQEIEEKYQNEVLNSKNTELLKDNAIKEQKAAEQKVWILGLGFSAAFLALLVLLFNRRKLLLEKRQIIMEKNINDIEQKALKSQINTHFIFNALDIARGFIQSNEMDKAQRHLNELTKLIRLTLENASETIVSIDDEILCLKAYVEVCRMVNGSDFETQFVIPKNMDFESVGIPPLLIQPFVENAIVHGLSDIEVKGELKVIFKVKEHILTCEIQNTLSSSKKSEKQDYKKKSMGMEITKERISNNNKESGVSNEIEIFQVNNLNIVKFSLALTHMY